MPVPILRDHPRLGKPVEIGWRGAFAALFALRAVAAVYMIVADCDEVYNYWEPVHLLAAPTALAATPVRAFETWEYAPQYAIRSWAYIALHAAVPAAVLRAAAVPPHYAFYALRLALAALSAAADATLYRSVADTVNARVARYMLVFLATSAGVTVASVALLPSSFVMYTTSMAMAAAMRRASTRDSARTFAGTAWFALGALGGWPFALVIALPFVFEELCLASGDAGRSALGWRWARWLGAVGAAALLAVPIAGIDTLAYGRVVLVALNTVLYNVLGRARGIGPELYGVEPWTYYGVNLLLNFSVAMPLALVSLVGVWATAARLPARFSGAFAGTAPARGPGSSPAVLLGIRMLPVYLWVGMLTLQAHKEERFLYPIYPLLCFNAGVGLFLVRSWLEAAYLRLTRSPYRASRSWLFPAATLVPLLLAGVLGLLRVAALVAHYSAPMDIALALRAHEHALPTPPAPRRLCYGKEWHRFPSHFFVPAHVEVQFVRSEFRGILPHHFTRGDGAGEHALAAVDQSVAWVWPWRAVTRTVSRTVNERNEEEGDRYVPVDTCDFLIDVDWPARPATEHEPRYAALPAWRPLACAPFLDAEASRHAPPGSLSERIVATLARILWVPERVAHSIPGWDASLRHGAYCLLARVG
ncbi:dextrin dextranase [Malassezia sp. CBS 17886]|nr:dextrin dextranase [Malassezia sp. CBS 17886]